MRPGPDFEPLRGKLVVLKPRDEKLLEVFYEKRFAPEVLGWADTWPRDQTPGEFVQRFHAQEDSENEFRLWIFTASGKLIGEVSIFDIDRTRSRAEFGIVIVEPSYWGQGYGTEAARLFLACVCARFSLSRVYLSTSAENKRGIRSFQKLGFRITQHVAGEAEKGVKMEAEADMIT